MNILEGFRKANIEHIFKDNFLVTWNVWKLKILDIINNDFDEENMISLGKKLREIFFTTDTGDRDQSDVSNAGKNWERLVCWYLNLCLLESRTVVIFPIKKFIPTVITEAMSVNYGNYKTNTESDLIAITFPKEINEIKEEYSLNRINLFLEKNIGKLNVCTLQCKTNWNDNAQIPMLWDLIYKSEGFEQSSISLGKNGRSISDFNKFKYSFVTIPTQKKYLDKFKVSSTAVNRVRNLSGGNYWGVESAEGVADNISEIFTRNFSNGTNKGSLRDDLKIGLSKITNDYSYFNLHN